ncbi:MAG: 50S ribosomal protein L30 [archaeon]
MIILIRIRGLKNVRPEIRRALETLNLDRKNHCVLIPLEANDMALKKVQDYTAYGKVSPEMLGKLLQKRGRMEGDQPITEKILKEHHLSSFTELAHALEGKKTTLKKVGIKPVFRLNSPRKGYGKIGIKKPVALKGPLGYHPNGMDELLGAMM